MSCSVKSGRISALKLVVIVPPRANGGESSRVNLRACSPRMTAQIITKGDCAIHDLTNVRIGSLADIYAGMAEPLLRDGRVQRASSSGARSPPWPETLRPDGSR